MYPVSVEIRREQWIPLELKLQIVVACYVEVRELYLAGELHHRAISPAPEMILKNNNYWLGDVGLW